MPLPIPARVLLARAPQRVLVIRPSALGDVSRTTPVLVSLKRAFPEAKIDWLVHEAYAGAIEAHPDLNEVVLFRRKALGRWYTREGIAAGWAIWKRLRHGYDLVVDCQGLARSGLLAWLSGAPVRVGHADAREGATWAYTHRIEPGDAVHTVDRMLTLVSALEVNGQPVKAVADARLYPATAELATVESDARLVRPYAVLAPTTRWPGKRWPIERFVALAGELVKMGMKSLVVVGSAGERAECAPLLAMAGRGLLVVDLVGATSVARLLAVVARADLVVGNDSASLHMAVGCGKPLVALFGPTDVARVGPFGRAADVVQHLRAGERLDHKNEAAGRVLMERISVEEVAARCRAALASGDGSGRAAHLRGG